MPQVEAAGCGIPLASINYSAMSDVVKKTNGILLKVQKLFYEWETNAFRAYPDNDYTADAIFKFFNQSEDYRQTKSKQARQAAEKWFNWDRSAKIWSDYFKSVVLTGKQGQWNAPIMINDFNIPPYQDFPNMTNTQYVEWLCNFVAKDVELFSSFLGISAIEQLNNGITCPFKEGRPISRKNMYDMFKTLGNNRILCEQARVGMHPIPMTDFIQFAHEFEEGLIK